MYASQPTSIDRIRIGCLMLFCTMIAMPQETAEAGKEASNPFQSMLPLVGHSYLGTFPNGKMTDEQHFQWVYDGKFVRNVHYVRNQKGEVVYEGETIFAYDREKKRLVYWYWNITGGYLTGWAESENGRQVWYGKNHADAAQTKESKSAVWDVSPESYKATQYFRKDGEWQEQWSMTYLRKK